MKKQALSLFLAGALALSLFGCSGGAAPRDHRRKRHLYHLCGERRIWKDVL